MCLSILCVSCAFLFVFKCAHTDTSEVNTNLLTTQGKYYCFFFCLREIVFEAKWYRVSSFISFSIISIFCGFFFSSLLTDYHHDHRAFVCFIIFLFLKLHNTYKHSSRDHHFNIFIFFFSRLNIGTGNFMSFSFCFLPIRKSVKWPALANFISPARGHCKINKCLFKNSVGFFFICEIKDWQYNRINEPKKIVRAILHNIYQQIR